jgi:plastocyanin
MQRMRHMSLLAGAIASLTVFTAGQVSAASPRTVEIVGQDELGAGGGTPFYFKQGRLTVHQNDTVVWRNESPAPHSITIVNRDEVPQTLDQAMNCPLCDTFIGAHVPTLGPDGPVPPFVANLDNFKVSAASPARLDGRGDSLVIAEQGKTYPATVGGVIGDAASAVITAPAGTTLTYLCALHPWMQGEIQVVPNSQR